MNFFCHHWACSVTCSCREGCVNSVISLQVCHSSRQGPCWSLLPLYQVWTGPFPRGNPGEIPWCMGHILHIANTMQLYYTLQLECPPPLPNGLPLQNKGLRHEESITTIIHYLCKQDLITLTKLIAAQWGKSHQRAACLHLVSIYPPYWVSHMTTSLLCESQHFTLI